MRETEKQDISTPTSSSRTVCSLLKMSLIAPFIRVDNSRDGEPHDEPQATTVIPSVQREGRGSFLVFFSQAKSLLKGTMNTEHLIFTLPPPRTPTGRCPCLDVITGVPAISSAVASSITTEVGQRDIDTVIRFLASYV